MAIKRVLRPERLRRVPPQFSWVDQRLVRDGYLERCDAVALALYLLLVTVADAQGLSYYGEARSAGCYRCRRQRLDRARRDLIGVALDRLSAAAVPGAGVGAAIPTARLRHAARRGRLVASRALRRGASPHLSSP